MPGDVRRIAPDERTKAAATAGMIREEAVTTDGMWAGLARTEAGMVSDWHHHGAYESAIYVLSGALRWSSVREAPRSSTPARVR